VRPTAALALLGALATTALLADHLLSVAVIALLLVGACLRAPRGKAVYLIGTGISAAALFVLTPLIETIGSHPLWTGPIVPVLGQIDITSEELVSAAQNALQLLAVGFAFAAYALLLDHDRLLHTVRFARPAALATRLVPTLQRDASGLVESLRGRGIEVDGVRGRAALLSPLLASSLERGLSLAEAMEARGYGRPGRSSIPAPAWRVRDIAALVLSVAIVVAGALWL
jgi:energy-coupling factor transport system permease protein